MHAHHKGNPKTQMLAQIFIKGLVVFVSRCVCVLHKVLKQRSRFIKISITGALRKCCRFSFNESGFSDPVTLICSLRQMRHWGWMSNELCILKFRIVFLHRGLQADHERKSQGCTNISLKKYILDKKKANLCFSHSIENSCHLTALSRTLNCPVQCRSWHQL